MEEWRSVYYLGVHTFYEVSSFGRLRNREYNRILKLHKNTPGYYHVTLSISGLRFVERIHVLVAQAFLPKPSSKHKLIIHHKDNNKENNHISNLQYVDQVTNTQEYYLHKERMLEKRMQLQQKQIDDLREAQIKQSIK